MEMAFLSAIDDTVSSSVGLSPVNLHRYPVLKFRIDFGRYELCAWKLTVGFVQLYEVASTFLISLNIFYFAKTRQ